MFSLIHQIHWGTGHVGNLGNIEADSEGQAEVNITDRTVSLMGEYSVIGCTAEVRRISSIDY